MGAVHLKYATSLTQFGSPGEKLTATSIQFGSPGVQNDCVKLNLVLLDNKITTYENKLKATYIQFGSPGEQNDILEQIDGNIYSIWVSRSTK